MDQNQKFFDALEEMGITPEKAASLICRLNSFLEFKGKKEERKTASDNIKLYSEDLTKKITHLLTSWGFKPSLLGFGYLRESIKYVINNGNVSYTETLYPEVARLYKTTSFRVERAIRHSIEKAFSKYTPLIEIMGETLDTEKGKPTNSELIAFVANHIQTGLL